jgi:hypothetical protein
VYDALLFPQHARCHLYTLTAQLTVAHQPEETPRRNCCVDLSSPLRWPEQRPATKQTAKEVIHESGRRREEWPCSWQNCCSTVADCKDILDTRSSCCAAALNCCIELLLLLLAPACDLTCKHDSDSSALLMHVLVQLAPKKCCCCVLNPSSACNQRPRYQLISAGKLHHVLLQVLLLRFGLSRSIASS